MKKTWKPIEIDGSLFSNGIEGLVGIEECTDYNLNDIVSNNIKKRKCLADKVPEVSQKKKKKSKNQRANDEVKKDTKNESLAPSTSGNTSRIEESLDSNDDDSDALTENMEAWSSYGLPPPLLKALEELKFTNPTQIQALTLPPSILGHRDILGAAETGSGKTLAFGLPILTGILNLKENPEVEVADQLLPNEEDMDSEESDFEADINENDIGCVKLINNVKISESSTLKPLYALILTPTRELAMQVKNHLTAVAKYTGVNIAVVVGGLAAVKQARILSKGPEIVVATPGRLWELIQEGNSHLSQIDSIRYLAIDETDRMLERGHFQELHSLLERINLDESKRKLRQNFVFSATLTLVHDLPSHLKFKRKIKNSKKVQDMTAEQKLKKIIDLLGITDPKVFDVTQGKGTSETLTECRITCDIDEKDYYVYYFLKKHPGRTLIFCNSIGCVKRLATLLSLLDCHPLPLHASMQQRQRIKNLERFRDTENSILVATDVAARGLDIPCVEHVLHYQTPRTSESYVHRSGRTARASRQGITVLLIEPQELKNYLKLCKTLGKNEDLPIFPIQQNYLNAVKQRVNLARELDKLQLQIRKTNSETGWFQKAAEDMDIIVDDFSRKYDSEEARQFKKIADLKRKQLTSLLSYPIFPKGFSGKYPLSSEVSLAYIMDTSKEKEEKAIDVMKNAIEFNAKSGKKNTALFKPRKRDNNNQQKNKIGASSFKRGSLLSKKKNKSKKR